MFKPGNKESRLGGLAKRGHGNKQVAAEWVKSEGFEKAIAWVNGQDGEQKVPWPSRQFAMGLLFSYGLGRPAETLEVKNTTEVLLSLANDPAILEIARNFGSNAGRIRQVGNGELVDRAITVQAESPATPSV